MVLKTLRNVSFRGPEFFFGPRNLHVQCPAVVEKQVPRCARDDKKGDRSLAERGQAATELAFLVPLLMMILFGTFQVGRVFFLYHTLQKALRGGAGMLARSANVNYCSADDGALADARNFIVFGNLQGMGTPVVQGLTPEMVQILPERTGTDSTAVTECLCTEEGDSCDVS